MSEPAESNGVYDVEKTKSICGQPCELVIVGAILRSRNICESNSIGLYDVETYHSTYTQSVDAAVLRTFFRLRFVHESILYNCPVELIWLILEQYGFTGLLIHYSEIQRRSQRPPKQFIGDVYIMYMKIDGGTLLDGVLKLHFRVETLPSEKSSAIINFMDTDAGLHGRWIMSFDSELKKWRRSDLNMQNIYWIFYNNFSKLRTSLSVHEHVLRTIDKFLYHPLSEPFLLECRKCT